MKGRSLKELVLSLVLIYLMVMSLNFAALDSTGMSISASRMALYSLGISVAVVVASSFPLVLLLYLAVAGGGVLYIYRTDPGILSGLWQLLNDFFIWLPGYIMGYTPFDDRFSMAFALAYILLSVFIITLLARFRYGGFLLILLGTAAITFFWFIYVEKARLYLMIYLFAAIMLYSYRKLQANLLKWRKEKYDISSVVKGYWITNSAVIIIAAIAFTMLLPVNIKPVRWNWLNDKVLSVFPFLLEWRNDTMESYDYGFGSRYGINQVGYKNRRLGGPVNLDKRVMLNIKTNGTETLYLRGTIKDRYTGSGWQKSTKKYKTVKSGDPIYLSSMEDSIAGRPEKLEITPVKLLTSTVLAPYKLTRVRYQGNHLFVDDDSEAYFPKLITKSESYTAESSIPYIDEARLREAGADKSLPYAYFMLPDNITYRTKQLAWSITKDCKNDYDKVKAIEGYLRSSYKYSLTPGQPPSNREFVDYFLFDGKEGYCTYFASSMAVLLRASGIPCRYVEGFLLKDTGSSDRNVTGEDAHAWVEVCFNEFGWINFEATPAYPVVQHVRQQAETGEEAAAAPEESPRQVEVSGAVRPNRAMELEDEGDFTGAAPQNKNALHIDMILWVILGLLVLRVVYLVAARLVFEAKMKSSQGRVYAAKYIKDILWYIKKMNVKLEPGETLREYMARTGQHLNGNMDNIPRITGIIEKARYSEAGISASEKSELEVFRGMVKKLARFRLGAMRLYFSMYFIGK